MFCGFFAVLKTFHFSVKTALTTFWANFGKFGLIFIFTSGHTGSWFHTWHTERQ